MTIIAKTEDGRNVRVELVEGCGEHEGGASLRFDGICVAHLTWHADIPKLDIYPTAAHVAGIRWIDVYRENYRGESQLEKSY